MTASPAAPAPPPIPTVLTAPAAVADRAHIELRRLLLSHLTRDVDPQHLAGVVVKLCTALSPMLARPPVSLGARAELSHRELQVLAGMANGSGNAQIGQELHLSEHTVKTYTRRLYATLGVRDRAHAVARGFQLGILVVWKPGDQHQPGTGTDLGRRQTMYARPPSPNPASSGHGLTTPLLAHLDNDRIRDIRLSGVPAVS